MILVFVGAVTLLAATIGWLIWRLAAGPGRQLAAASVAAAQSRRAARKI